MRRMRYWMIGVLIVLALTVSCAPTATPTTVPATSVPTTAPATEATPVPTAAATEAPTPEVLNGSFTAAGSTSLQPLAEKLSAAFDAANPGVAIDIQGGGSGVGVKVINDGTAELGMVSRELKEEEKPGVVVYTVAKDAIAIITHPDVAVTELTTAQVRDIFSGVIANWKEVGGADKPIIVVAREEGSGTRAAFEELVMGKEAKILTSAILQSSNGAILTTVSTTPDSIAFLSLGMADQTIKLVPINGVEATEANAASGKYTITRPLSFISKGEPKGVVKAFLDWAFSPAGQKIVSEEGYIPVK